MGTVVEFSQARRRSRQNRMPVEAGPAVIVILPSIRIERELVQPPAPPRQASQAPANRKRRKRATRT
jgi:hypothetical protein